MNIFRPRAVSNFFPIIEFDSKEKLLSHPMPTTFQKDKDFYRFSIENLDSTVEVYAHCLMAEMEEGKKWWVMGWIKDPIPDDWFPIWEPKE